MLDRSIRCQPFEAETVELFTSLRWFIAHLLAKRFTGAGASEAGDWKDQRAGSARLRGASEGLQPLESEAFFLAMPPNFHARDPDFAGRLKLQLLRFQLDAS